MKPVTGYMTSKGEFYSRYEDAQEQETWDKLSDALTNSLFEGMKSQILAAVRSYPQEFLDHATAIIAAQVEEIIVIEET